MIEYLEGKPIEVPTAVTKRKRKRKGEGTLTSNISRGDLFLTDSQGKSFRVSWDTKGNAKPEPRSLPAGKYRLRTYRIEHEEKGVSWHVSGTAHKIQELEVSRPRLCGGGPDGGNHSSLIATRRTSRDPTGALGTHVRKLARAASIGSHRRSPAALPCAA